MKRIALFLTIFGTTLLGQNPGDLEAEFDALPGEKPKFTPVEEEPVLELDDYVELVKAAHPPEPAEYDFYEQFIKFRDYYATRHPSVFENPSWPLFIAMVAEKQLVKIKVAHKARNVKRMTTWKPSNGMLRTASLGSYKNRDPRSPANDKYVSSTHGTIPLRSNALGSAYQWKNGKWTFSGRGWKRINGKWVKVEEESGLQGASGLGKSK